MFYSSPCARLATISAMVLLSLVAADPPCHAAPGDSDDLVVGFLYVGPKDDYGYSNAPARGAAALKKKSGVMVLEVEKLEESEEARKVMEKLIDVEGARMIFAMSFGYYDPHLLAAAKKYPKVQFLHISIPWKKGDPENIFSFNGYTEECRYLSGVVAGHMTKSNKLGFVAAKPIPSVRRDVNAFCLGARSINPQAEVHVVFTGDWSEPTKEADATKKLIDKGCDVFTCFVDSPRTVIETAEKAGKYTCGFHMDQSALAPKGYLTGAEWNWERVCVDLVSKVQKKEKIGNTLRGGLKEGMVKMSPYGKAVTAQARKDADAARARFVDGSLVVFTGPLKDNNGKVVIPAGEKHTLSDPKLEQMDYLAEGVIRVE